MEELRADLDALEATNRNAAGELREQARLLSARDDELRKLRAAAASAEGLREEAVREAAERTRLERLVRRRAYGSPPLHRPLRRARSMARRRARVTRRCGEGMRQVGGLQEQVRELEAAAFANYTVPVRLAFPVSPCTPASLPLSSEVSGGVLPVPSPPPHGRPAGDTPRVSVLEAAQAAVAAARWAADGAAWRSPPPHLGRATSWTARGGGPIAPAGTEGSGSHKVLSLCRSLARSLLFAFAWPCLIESYRIMFRINVPFSIRKHVNLRVGGAGNEPEL